MFLIWVGVCSSLRIQKKQSLSKTGQYDGVVKHRYMTIPGRSSMKKTQTRRCLAAVHFEHRYTLMTFQLLMERQTDRHTDTQTHRHTDTQTERERQRHRDRHRQRDRDRNRQTDGQTQTQTQTGRRTERERQRQRDRETDRDRQRQRQKDRETETDRQRAGAGNRIDVCLPA